MNCLSFARMLAKQSVVVGLAGDERLASDLMKVADHFGKASGTVATHLKKIPSNKSGNHHDQLVRVLDATSDVHRSASARSTAAKATQEVARALKGSSSASLDDAMRSWESAASTKAKPTSRSPALRKKVVDGYVSKLEKADASAALELVDDIKKDKQVRHAELKAIMAQVLDRRPAAKTKARDLEELRRYFYAQRESASKSRAIRG